LMKAQLANQYRAEGLLNPAEAEHVIEGNIGGVFGLQDNPHRLRVRRQIAQWQEGPPKGLGSNGTQPSPMPQGVMPSAPGQPPTQPPNGNPVAPGVPPTSGGPMAPAGLGLPAAAPPPNPFAPLLAQIFAPGPQDDEPPIAMLRMFELGRALASTKFQRWPPAWGQGLVLAYQQARQASQIPDAKMAQTLQEELQKAQKELNEAKIKLNAASVSIALKGADLDEGQTVAILADEGIRLPPRASPLPGPPPTLDPTTELEHKTAIESAKIAADLDKHKTTEHGKLEMERIRAVAKEHLAAREHQHALKLAELTKPVEKPKKHKVVRGKDGKIEGLVSE